MGRTNPHVCQQDADYDYIQRVSEFWAFPASSVEGEGEGEVQGNCDN
jgi:hypothetical protein